MCDFREIFKKSLFSKIEFNEITKKKNDKVIQPLDLVFIKAIKSFIDNENISGFEIKSKDIFFQYFKMVFIFKVYPEDVFDLSKDFRYISYNIFLKNYYNLLHDYTSNYKAIRLYVNSITHFLYTEGFLEKVKVYRKFKFQEVWCLKISLDDYDKLLYIKWNSNVFISFKKPYKWFLNNGKIMNEVYFKNSNDYEELSLKSIYTKGKILEENHIRSIWEKEVIDWINSLQEICFKFDLDLFKKVFREQDIYEYFLKNQRNHYSIFLGEAYQDYILENQEKYYTKNDKSLKKVLKYIKFYHSDLIDIKKITANDIDVLNFLYNYKEDYLYIYLFLDHRGRLYTKGNISYINSKLLRFLVSFTKSEVVSEDRDRDIWEKYYLMCQINKKVKSFKEAEVYYKDIDFSFLRGSSINFDKIVFHGGKTISLDATSSMLQIIALLTKNEKLMFYTNLIEHYEKVDIYDYIIDIIKKKVKPENIFYEYYTSRKYVKYSIMLYIYGSQPLYTAKSLYEKFNLRTIHIKDLTSVINEIIKVFNKEFPVVKVLMSVMKKYIKKSIKDAKFITVNTLIKKMIYSCPSTKKIHINYKNLVRLNFYIMSDKKTSDKKAKKSFFVNLIHSFDSEICILTRKDLLRRNIQSLSIHDSFVVNIEHYKDCLECYNKNLKGILNISYKKLIPDFEKYLDKKDFSKLESFETLDIDNYSIEKCYYTLKPE